MLYESGKCTSGSLPTLAETLESIGSNAEVSLRAVRHVLE